MTTQYERVIEALREHVVPAAVVDLDAFDANAALAEAFAAKAGRPLPIRVATKSLRVPGLIRRVLDRGPAWKGVMCFAAGEMELLAADGVDDFLLAYPVVDAPALAQCRRVHESGATVALVVDCAEHVERLERAFAGCSRPVGVVVDLDASLRAFGAHLGVRRSPVRTAEHVARVFDACGAATTPRGLMAYEAQVAGLPDASRAHRGRNLGAKVVRALSIPRVARLRAECVGHLRDRGVTLHLVNGGGTGSLDSTPHDRSVTEVTMGSGLYCPHSFDGFSHVAFSPACFFALSVVRTSDRGFVTCAGGGYIASGASGPDRAPLPVFPVGLSLLSAEGAGEVQTPLRVAAEAPALGDVVLFRHAKAGELMERFATVACVSGGELREELRTYRGLGAAFF